MSRGHLIVAAAIAVVALGGCGGVDNAESGRAETTSDQPRELRDLTITLEGHPDAEDGGILMARDKGYFEEVGLSVEAYTPINPRFPLPYLVNRSPDLAVLHGPQVALAQEKGAPITRVGTVIGEPTAAMIWLPKANVESVADLRGRTIAIPGLPFQERLLRRVLARSGLALADVNLQRVDFELVEALVSARADAIFGGSWNIEGIELEEMALKPVITRVQDLGIPPYEELVLAARSDFATREPQLMDDVMEAVERGTEAAVRDPEGVVKATAFENPNFDPAVAKAQVRATLPLLAATQP